MKLTINNMDGKGAVDYTCCVVEGRTFRIDRKLNAPSLFYVTLLPSASALSLPVRNGRVVVADTPGNILFTGYVANEPAMSLAGESTTGQIYAAEVTAISDDILLDRLALAQNIPTLGQTAQQVLQSLTGGLGVAQITANLSSAVTLAGQFHVDAGAPWSTNAAELTRSTGSAYRIVNGVLTAAPVASVTHTLSEANGTLALAELQSSQVKTLANDITVCGETEPCAYITEYFEGDGTTLLFDLTEDPWEPSASRYKPLIDLFQQPAVNPLVWSVVDDGHISVTSAGLTCNGGNGLDGAIYVAALSSLELGGSITLEADGVQFGATTQGILNGVYHTTVSTSSCIAGFQIAQTSGATTISPLIQGSVAGSPFTPTSGHVYTLRLRIYTNEMQRMTQPFYYTSNNGVGMTGGTYLSGAISVILEVQDMTGGVAGAPSILYNGAIASAPSVATYALLNNANLQCSIASVEVSRQGPAWVVSTPTSGSPFVRRIGTTAQGADCKIERTGKLHFYPASVPQAGEIIAVSYRSSRRSVARLASPGSIASEASGGLPGTAAWMGTVTQPAPRSSLDCQNAAAALLAISTSRAAAWKGKYTGWNLDQSGDVWPGDALAITSASANMTATVVVRSVQIDLTCSQPPMARYTIAFANDWADALAIKTSTTVPADAWLPAQPQTTAPLANLDTLTITAVTPSQIDISANTTPPAGGGFEVRRRDWAFGPGTSSDLVLRSPAPGFVIPREAAVEQYYIRMYDGSTPPNYSAFSAAVFVNLPL